jgi:hypothetical protein
MHLGQPIRYGIAAIGEGDEVGVRYEVDVITGAGRLGAVVTLLVILLAEMVYLCPFIVAQTRRASSVGAVFGVNLLFGWSIVGWSVALLYGTS